MAGGGADARVRRLCFAMTVCCGVLCCACCAGSQVVALTRAYACIEQLAVTLILHLSNYEGHAEGTPAQVRAWPPCLLRALLQPARVLERPARRREVCLFAKP